MKRVIALLSVFLVLGFALAAADVTADSFPAGAVTEDMALDGINLSLGTGSVTVEAAPDAAVSADGTQYSQVFVISGDASFSFDGTAGQKLSVTAAVPSDGTAFEVLVAGADTSELVGGETTDGAVVYVDYTLPADGSYTVTFPSGTASVYQITLE